MKLHHIPRKDNDATDFLAKLAARWDPSPSGVFINDLHEPSTHILEGPVQTYPDANPTLGGSDANTKPALGGSDPSASMTRHPPTSPYWHSIKPTGECRYSPTSSRRSSHPKGLKPDESLDAPRPSSCSVMNSTNRVHQGYS